MKRILSLISLGVILISVDAAAQEKFEPTVESRREAGAKGRVREFQAAMEVLGAEAEKKERWAEASRAYSEASFTAKTIGQLQKAISLATKAIELAQRAKDPSVESTAMSFLALAYADVGQPAKEREWLKKALCSISL